MYIAQMSAKTSKSTISTQQIHTSAAFIIIEFN